MEKYMGVQLKAQPERPLRELPCINIAGTLFQVDIEKREFRALDNPNNRMPLGNVKEEYGFSTMLFDTMTKNLYTGPATESKDVPDHVRLVIVPPLKELDPARLARLHGFSDDYYSNLQVENKPKVLTAISKDAGQMERPKKRKRLSI